MASLGGRAACRALLFQVLRWRSRRESLPRIDELQPGNCEVAYVSGHHREIVNQCSGSEKGIDRVELPMGCEEVAPAVGDHSIHRENALDEPCRQLDFEPLEKPGPALAIPEAVDAAADLAQAEDAHV